MTDEQLYSPPAFVFGVWLAPGISPGAHPAIDAVFQQVSGIEPHVANEAFVEGGVNAYVHPLPHGPKSTNLVLKRGHAARASALAQWVDQAVGSTLGTPIATAALNVGLLGPDMQPTMIWSFQNAWPVKWEVDAFDAEGDRILIEALEIAYTSVTRTAQS